MSQAAGPVSTPRSVVVAALLSVALFLGLGAATGHRIAQSGDAASAWATAEPHRTVLCVERGPEPAFTVAAEPTDDDRASVGAALTSTETRLGPLVVRDHTYRAVVDLGPFEIPWMKNEYTGAWAEWPAHLAWRATGRVGAGRAVHLLLGALVVLAAALLAGRLAGWPAAAVCGLLLATDPWFHVFKKHLGGQEVMLQLLEVACVSLLCAVLVRGGRRRLLLAGLLVGLGLHTKLSFAAVAAALALVAAALLPWRRLAAREGRWRRLGLGGLLLAALTLGSAPTWTFWMARDASGAAHTAGAQENVRGRLDMLLQRHLPSLATGDDVQRKRKDGSWQRSPKKAVGPADLLLRPRRLWHDGYAIRSRQGNQPPHGEGPAWRATRLEQVAAVATVALLLAALVGLGSRVRRRRREPDALLRAALALAGVAVVLPLCLELLHPDSHHLALWMPVLAPAVGVGVAALVRSRAEGRGGELLAGLLVAATLLSAIGRTSSLVLVERDLDAQVGRLSEAPGQARLARALAELGARSPAVLEYDLMSQLDGWSGGAVRPWLYARSALGSGQSRCLRSTEPGWLARIVEAHAGGHLVVTWGVVGNLGGAQPTSWASPEQVRQAARTAGVSVEPVAELFDDRERWYATIWAIGEP